MDFYVIKTIKKRYTSQTKRQQIFAYFFCFSVIFIITWLLAYFALLWKGKGLIWQDDSLACMYEMVGQHRRIAQEVFGNLMEHHKLRIPWVNYNLTGDNNLFCIVAREFSDAFYWFIPPQYYELVYSIIIVLHLWLAGVSFSLYCMRRRYRKQYILLGSLIYTFCGYAMFYASTQPVFIVMLYMTPILFIGVEDIFDGKSGKIFSIMIFLSWFHCVFTTYYNTIVVGLYFLVRCAERGVDFKTFVNRMLKTGAYYLVGFGLGGFIFIPECLSILSSGRMHAGMDISFTYGLSYFAGMIKDFFIINHLFDAPQNDYYLGFSVVTMFPFLYLFLFSKKKVLKIGFILLIIFLNLPVFGFLAGAGIVNNRWSYFLGFAAAYIFMEMIPKLLSDLPETQKRWMNLVAVLWILIFVWSDRKREIDAIKIQSFTVIIMAAMIICMNVIWRINKRYVSVFILTGMIMLSAVLNGISIFDKTAQSYAERGHANEVLNQYADAAMQRIEDTSFFRVDKSGFTDELSCNLPFWYGFNGISSFANTLNVSSAEYFRKMENTGLLQANKYASLGGKATDEALAGVKYYILDKKGTQNVPYGFESVSGDVENKQYALYVNRYALPLGFTYEKSISMSEFEALSIAQKQEVLLKRILLEESNKNSSSIETLHLGSKELEWDIVDSYNMEKTDDGWHVTGCDAYITVLIDAENVGKESELYLRLSGIKNKSKSTYTVTVSAPDKEETIYTHGISSARSNGQQDFTFHLGNETERKVKAKISFPSDSGVFVEELQAYARDMQSYVDDINQLTKEQLEDVCFETNRVKGNIDVENSKYLCFSIPYSKGWSCYIDGEKTDILKANTMYMAVWLNAGSHQIELRYLPFGMRLGAVISLMTLFMVACSIVHKKYNQKHKS